MPAAIAANTAVLPGTDLPTANSIPAALFFVEIGYGDNLCDVYQIPLAFSKDGEAEDLTANRPQSIVAVLPTPTGSAVLHDATVREDLRQSLLMLIERNATLALSTTRTAALEVAATLAAAATGKTANEELASGQAADLLDHPERATHDVATDGRVHLRPHEEFPTQDALPATDLLPEAIPVSPEETPPPAPHPLSGIPVAPAPISAQPGEAVALPRSTSPSPSSATHRLQPRESPSAGDPTPLSGRLDARASTAFARTRNSHRLPARVGSAEQSNTSVLYGKELIMKLFRRLQPGENPDVEIGRFLTEIAHFERIAPFLGEITITPSGGEKTTVAMLQGLVANQGDGWQWFLDQLPGFFNSVASLHAPETATPGFIRQDALPADAQEYAGPALEAAALLGRRTAEMHLALATATDDPAFAAEPFTAEDLNRDALRIDAQITATLDALKAKLPTLVDMIADDAALLLSRRRELISRAHAIETSQAAGKRIRIHGDYHLGQTLRTGGTETEPSDFVLLDFEGEPARPLAERRQKQSPLKDVAGMVRSFSYAAYSGLDQFTGAGDEHNFDREMLAAWAGFWQNATSTEFLRAYRATIASNSELLPPPEQAQSLLTAYMLEKALYELLYELNNRPTWLRIPIGGILSM
jgi:maltose alpha-D-glucosyltransferase/alpha-amylase